MSEREIAEDPFFQASSRIQDYVDEEKENTDDVSMCEICNMNTYECECQLKENERSYL